MTDILITMGLPGSGKTFFCDDFEENYKKNNSYKRINNINIDKLKESFFDKDKPFSYLVKSNICYFDNINIIDGPFFSESDIIEILKVLKLKEINNIEIHYWEPDINICLWNDKGRRDKDSTITIKNCKIQKPNIEKLKKDFNFSNISLTYHQIIKKPDWIFKVENLGININKSKYLYSEEWSLGGHYENMKQDYFNIDADTPPNSFYELDDLLENVCPNLTFLQYKNILRNFVEIEKRTEDDYYNSSQTFACYKCDLNKMFDYLKEKGYKI